MDTYYGVSFFNAMSMQSADKTELYAGRVTVYDGTTFVLLSSGYYETK